MFAALNYKLNILKGCQPLVVIAGSDQQIGFKRHCGLGV
jgi:hypothetical protein